MQPILHKTSNHIYKAPAGSTGICDLPVTVGGDCIYSFWQPSEVDIANILAGVPIRLGLLVKNGLPPLNLAVTDKVE
jgi:hypothetical protein